MPDRGFELSYQLELGRKPDDVFALIADPSCFRAIDPAMIDFGPRATLRAGAEGWFKHRRGPMTARTTWQVTAFDPPTRMEVEISGSGYRMTESALLETSGSGTRATFVDRVWPTSIPGRLLVALSGGVMRRDLLARAQRLRSILEGPEDPSP